MEDGLFGQLGVNARSLAGEDQKQDFEHARTLLLCMEVMRVKVEASNQRTATLLNVKVSTYILHSTLIYVYLSSDLKSYEPTNRNMHHMSYP